MPLQPAYLAGGSWVKIDLEDVPDAKPVMPVSAVPNGQAARAGRTLADRPCQVEYDIACEIGESEAAPPAAERRATP